MSIIVKGMKMPATCTRCTLDAFGYCTAARRYSEGSTTHERASFCPLVELPEKHGRLIDADAFAKHLREAVKSVEAFAPQMATALEAAVRDLEDPKKTPTIVEAEGETYEYS